jgi:hypothetical protein
LARELADRDPELAAAYGFTASTTEETSDE